MDDYVATLRSLQTANFSLQKVSLNWWSTDLFALRFRSTTSAREFESGCGNDKYTYIHRYMYIPIVYTAKVVVCDLPPTRNGDWRARLPTCQGTDRISRRGGCLCVREHTGHPVPSLRPRPPESVIPIRDSSDPWTPASSLALCPLRK